jgi:hypothetical protein
LFFWLEHWRKSRGNVSEARVMVEGRRGAPERVARVLKAAVDAGTLADPTWAGNLSDFRTISTNFSACGPQF